MGLFSGHEREILTKLAEVVIPAGAVIPAAGPDTIDRMERYLDGVPPPVQVAARSAIWLIEGAAVPLARRPFSRLPLERRTALIRTWAHGDVAPVRHALRALFAALKSAHFDDPGMYARLGCEYGRPAASAENPRWLAQTTDGREVRDDQELEVDVVIVGTGAGGAPLAYELALRGHAVLMIEEGRYFRRHEFDGRPAEMIRKLYRDAGMTIAFGNVSVPVWAGRTVGGTTTVNSGTCYRTPERTLAMWRERFGLGMFSSETMAPYFERVEHVLGVAPAHAQHLDGASRVVARGADRLGWVHKPLSRNAPDCDGQGLCCFGCPTGAKRSTDVSYVPMALERNAGLFASTRVEKVIVEGGEARGVIARCEGGGTLTVRARMTVLACGSLMTPLLLQSNRLAEQSGMVGKNLSIHPAGAVWARFDETIDMHKGIPQGYVIEEFANEGMMLEGGSLPLDITAVGVPLTGPIFTDMMEHYRQLASFGYMIQDSSRGRVMRGLQGSPLITYNLNEDDARRMHRCAVAIARVFFAAGAKRVYPSVHGFDELTSESDFERFARAHPAPSDFDVTAYHPLGTARMGMDPATSVVGPDHQVHDVPNLYVVDGAAVPSSLGVNPQVTIMALATRAAEIMDRRLSGTADRADGTHATDSAAPGGWS